MKLSVEEQADEFVDRAWGADGAARAKFARKALAIAPDNIDAYVILSLVAETPAERIALLREAVLVGKRLWAEAIRRPSRHYFWLDIETRPFMRAVHNLALALWERGERTEACAQAGLLVKLNPNDNQGIRYLLLAWLPVLGDWTTVERILKRYPDDGGADYLYTACLNAFRTGRDPLPWLAEAIESNPHVPELLLGRKPMPRDSASAWVEAGSRAEAAGVVLVQREAWSVVEGALEWLAANVRPS